MFNGAQLMRAIKFLYTLGRAFMARAAGIFMFYGCVLSCYIKIIADTIG